MRSTVLLGPGVVQLENRQRPDAGSLGAVVKVVYAGVCGSDIWAFNGVAKRRAGQSMGHEFVGVVEAVGSRVSELSVGDEVVSPFYAACGTCRYCSTGLSTSCPDVSFYGRSAVASGAQSEFVGVPYAERNLVTLPTGTLAKESIAISCMLAGDVVSTARHALSMVQTGGAHSITVVGDGPIGLAAADLASRAGVEARVMGHHPERARHRKAGVEWIQADDFQAATRTSGSVDCVGTRESTVAAVSATDDGGSVGVVGVPHGVKEAPVSDMFRRNVGIRFGIAPAITYLPQIISDVFSGTDYSYLVDEMFDLQDVDLAYRAMSSRACLKPVIRVSRSL